MALRPCLLVHYHEISLKGGNHPLFLRHPARNLERATSNLPHVSLVRLPGRIMLELDDNPKLEAIKMPPIPPSGLDTRDPRLLAFPSGRRWVWKSGS
jgi:hypothetical protein